MEVSFRDPELDRAQISIFGSFAEDASSSEALEEF
jgi:hypothetical protein